MGVGGGACAIVFLFFNLLLLSHHSFSHPLCIDSTAPLTLNASLSFCSYDGSSCCNSAQDSQLAKQFQAMKISNPGCSSLLKSVVCSRCDPFAAELYPAKRPVPVLCNSTVAATSSQSNQADTNFCSQLWDTCQNVSMLNSPFAPSLGGQAGLPNNSNSTKLTDLWQSKSDFCTAFGGESADDSVCFGGEPVQLNTTGTSTPPAPPNGLCLEKIGNGSYLNMAAHPDGSNRAFFANQPGQIWMATIPDQGSKTTMGVDEASPFLDLTDVVNFDTEFGMMGIAFHPNFAQNGRLFASFNCDKVKWAGCNGRCSCNSEVNCDPSKLAPDNGAQPCQYQTVVAEYSANATSTTPSSATSAKPAEVRRIFTMGLPFRSHHGGQILFGPDGYLYFMMGDGGGTGDPYNFAQDKKSLLGKIMRLDVDNIPTAQEIANNSFWGNYSIPSDNPYKLDADLQPEIWALGLRNPWRCSFDSARPSYFLCADVGQDQYEEVDLITKGGNYGWRVFEGNYAYKPPATPGGNTLPSSINPIAPIMGYNHSTLSKNEGSASITGGYIYRSQTDPCMSGRYLYADLYASNVWAGTETPEDSGNFTANSIPFSCAKDSPIPCTTVSGSDTPSLGYIFSFGQDNNNDVFLLASSGVYRVVPPSRCNYACSKENATAAAGSPAPSAPGASSASQLQRSSRVVVLLLASLLFMFSCI
ncbi:unnamed protein product [Linum trigynum]|uniref:Glucose/Sorbosone dehydrogenase domain-containing protein n=1 Tax=Linum trigynum TaxID=586398 RepID=A0AAV2D7V3_9ROSI